MRLSKNLEQIFATDGGVITFEGLMSRISFKSFGVLLTILALPSALPLPAPGYSVPFGIALFFLGVQLVMRRDHPWFPESVRRREIRTKNNSKPVRYMVLWLGMFEKLVRPRLKCMYTNGICYRFLGCVVTACAISMMIPVPLTNTVPAMGVFLIGLGMLEEDGLAAFAGVFVAVAGLLLAAAVLIGLVLIGDQAVGLIKGYIKGFLGVEPTPAEAIVSCVRYTLLA